MKDDNKKFGYRQTKSGTKEYGIAKKISRTKTQQNIHPFRKDKDSKKS